MKTITAAILVMFCCWARYQAVAATITWGNTATNFNDGASWVGGGAPGPGDVATFPNVAIANQPVLTVRTNVGGVNFVTQPWLLASVTTNTALRVGHAGVTWSSGYVTSGVPLETVADATWSGGSNQRLYLTGALRGLPQTTITKSGTGQLYLNTANPFGGTLRIEQGLVYAYADGALGTGTVEVAGGTLELYNVLPDTSYRPATIVCSSGTIINRINGFSVPITLDGCTLAGGGTIFRIAGPIHVKSESFLGSALGMGSDATLTGDGRLVVQHTNLGGGFEARLAGNGSAFSGGVHVDYGHLFVDGGTSALGTGPVTVGYGIPGRVLNPAGINALIRGVLRTLSASCLDSVASVTILEGGAYVPHSTETKMVTIMPGGLISMLWAGSGTLNYSGVNQNITLWKGAIVSSTVPAPTRAEVVGLANGTGFGVYIGGGGAVNTAYTVGDDGSSTLYRGLASGASALTYSGTLTAAAGADIYLYCHPVGSLTLASAARFDFTASPAGKLTVLGDGDWIINTDASVMNLPAVIERDGYFTGLDAAGSLPADKTLNVVNGTVRVNNAAALSAGSTLNLNSNGWLRLDATDMTEAATVNINAGGGVRVESLARLSPSGMTINWAVGSKLSLHFTPVAALPAATVNKADILLRDHDVTTAISAPLFLGENTRLSISLNPNGLVPSPHTLSSSGGAVITNAAGSTWSRIAAPSGLVFTVTSPVQFGAAKVVIGDPAPYMLFGRGGAAGLPFRALVQNGLVYLNGVGTAVGEIEVVAGWLRAAAGTGLPASGCKLTIKGGGVLELRSDLSWGLGTGAAQVDMSGAGGAGFSAQGGAREVNLGGAGASVTWGSGNFVAAGEPLFFGSPWSDNTLTFINGIALNGATRTIHVHDNASSTADRAILSGALTGAGGGLIKDGAGTLVLSGVNTYDGATTVSNGTLLVNGTLAGAAAVRSGATLSGSGTVAGAAVVDSGATLSPGDGAGILTFQDGLTLEGGFVWTLATTNEPGVAGTDYDQIRVTGGAFTVGGPATLTLSFASLTNPDEGSAFWQQNTRTWRILDFSGSISAGVPVLTNPNWFTGDFTIGNNGGHIVLTWTKRTGIARRPSVFRFRGK